MGRVRFLMVGTRLDAASRAAVPPTRPAVVPSAPPRRTALEDEHSQSVYVCFCFVLFCVSLTRSEHSLLPL